MVNTRKPPTVTAAPTSPETLLIGSAEQADELLGTPNAASEFLRRSRSGPVEVVEVPGGGVVLPHGTTLRVDKLQRPEPRGAWARLELEHDPQREPPLRCAVDGEETPLEQVSPGVWRPVRGEPAESDG